jgi:hypothetical protein
VVSGGDEDANHTGSFELLAKEVAGVQRHSLVLEEIAADRDSVDSLPDGEIDQAADGASQLFATSGGYALTHPHTAENAVEMNVGGVEYGYHN